MKKILFILIFLPFLSLSQNCPIHVNNFTFIVKQVDDNKEVGTMYSCEPDDWFFFINYIYLT